MAESNEKHERSVFEDETRHRTFKILVEDKTFFVNPSFLAERSSYFETLLFGDFKEKNEGKAELKDVKAKDFEEFLLVLGADPKKKKKEVNASNFSFLVNFSHLWDVSVLLEECIDFIDTKYQAVGVDVKTAIDICSACEKIKTPVPTLKIAAAKLAQFPIPSLVEHGAQNVLTPLVFGAVVLASKKVDNFLELGVKNERPVACDYAGCDKAFEVPVVLKAVYCCPSHLNVVNEWSNLPGTKRRFKVFSVDQVDEKAVLDDVFFPNE